MRATVRASAVCLMSAALFGCGGEPSTDTPALNGPSAEIVERVAKAGPLLDLSEADLENGQALWRWCRSCHIIGGSIHGPGPNLAGVFERQAGAARGYIYSPAVREAGFVWTPELLNAWLVDPAGFLPGTRMVFRGFDDPADRRDLIAWLARETTRATRGVPDAPSDALETNSPGDEASQ